MVKLQKFTTRYGDVHTLVVPKAIMDAKKWKKGQKFIPSFNENGDLVYEEIEK